ncbi:MAG: prenyltransferase [Bacillota bacterium]|nr:prenyltransferase [Bacillota bacterium]
MDAPASGGRPSFASWLAFWARASRAPFLTASLFSVALGAAVARWDGYALSWGLLLLTMVGVAGAHLGVNLANDYADDLLGTDAVNRYRSPFNGGAGLIQAGLVAPRSVLAASSACLITAALAGVWLGAARGPVVLILMSLGFVLGVGYSADPLGLMRTGWGEAVAGLCCGPLVAFGSYFVLTGAVSASVLWPSLPCGLLVSAILVINEVPDYEADRSVNKDNLVVRYGRQAGVRLHGGLLVLTYGLIALFPLLGRMPWQAAAAVVTVPTAWRAVRIALARAEDPVAIIPANARTILLHAAVALLITGGYWMAGGRP